MFTFIQALVLLEYLIKTGSEKVKLRLKNYCYLEKEKNSVFFCLLTPLACLAS
jgi:hypothetical protein